MYKRTQQGFGLIEVLVALAIMAVGLLAVASFQSGLINESGSNKTRAEAVALAQQRIEELRNYSGEAYTSDDFAILFADMTDGNVTKFVGTNAVYRRSETILEPSDTKEIEVTVAWFDQAGERQDVSLSTELSWESPSLAGELDTLEEHEPFVRSATGRAELGEGEVLESDKPTKELGDLLGIIDRGDGDLRLSSGKDIVLTLKDACLLDDEGNRTEVECTDFVKISGRVYIDQTTKATNPTDVFVIASDAAFCQRYYLTTEYDVNGDPVSKDVPVDINNLNASDLATGPNGDYLFYEYTCYLGGGWHGNVGLIVTAKNNSQDSVKACVGDPVSNDAYADPEVAIRRVYRGMAFQYTDESKSAKVEGDDGEIVYYTVGVADALELPVPGAYPAQASHDFIISTLVGSDGSECITEGIMTRGDSNVSGVDGDLFAGNPTSFFCLNQNPDYVDSIKLQALDYYTDPNCPFDPSDPPNQRHIVTGTIHVHADESYQELAYAATVNTSDGPLNCDITDRGGFDGGKFSIDYQCDVYQWTNPWAGYIQLNISLLELDCETYRIYESAIESDFNLDRFECLPVNDTPSTGTVTFTGTIPAAVTEVIIDDAQGLCQIESTSYICKGGLIDGAAVWSGEVTFKTRNTKLCISTVSATNETPIISDGSKTSTISLSNESIGVLEVNVSEKDGNNACP